MIRLLLHIFKLKIRSDLGSAILLLLSPWLTLNHASASFQRTAVGNTNLLVEGNATAFGGIGLPNRAPAAVRAQSDLMMTLSSPTWFLSGERQLYAQERSSPFLRGGFSLGLQKLGSKALHRFSLGQSFRTGIWHELADLPQADRENLGVQRAVLCYELLQLNGIQLNLGLTRAAHWEQLRLQPLSRAGLYNRTAWQWPGQENSRLGIGIERDHTLSHRSLSVLFENQGFNGQTMSAEYVRTKDAQGLLIVSLKPPENLQAATQAVFTIHKNKTWQLDLDRKHTVWEHFVSHIKLELKRELNLGFKTTLSAGIGGKI